MISLIGFLQNYTHNILLICSHIGYLISKSLSYCLIVYIFFQIVVVLLGWFIIKMWFCPLCGSELWMKRSCGEYSLWPASSTWSQCTFCLCMEIFNTSSWWENSREEEGDGKKGQTQIQSIQWQVTGISDLRFPISIAQVYEVLNLVGPPSVGSGVSGFSRLSIDCFNAQVPSLPLWNACL